MKRILILAGILMISANASALDNNTVQVLSCTGDRQESIQMVFETPLSAKNPTSGSRTIKANLKIQVAGYSMEVKDLTITQETEGYGSSLEFNKAILNSSYHSFLVIQPLYKGMFTKKLTHFAGRAQINAFVNNKEETIILLFPA